MNNVVAINGHVFKEGIELSEDDIIELARTIAQERLADRTLKFSGPESVEKYLRAWIGTEHREVFLVMFLDSQHCVIKTEIHTMGTVDSAPVYVREIIKRMLQLNSSRLVAAHCHPSGEATPSHADQAITKRIKQALELVDGKLLDHLIVTPSSFVSLAEMGWV